MLGLDMQIVDIDEWESISNESNELTRRVGVI